MDSSALHWLPDACGGEAHCGGCLADLGALISQQEACFCKESVGALKLLAPNGVHFAWAHQAAATMWAPTTNWQQKQAVVFALEDQMDMELLDDEPELMSVLALAHVLSDDFEVTVVTEDDIDKVDCVSLVTGAEVLGLPTLDFDGFGAATGLDQHFV